MSTLADLSATIRSSAESVGPAVVGLGRGWGLGSGVVVGDGRVLTNAHNLRGSETTVTFADGRREAGEVTGTDPDVDLAAIAVDTGDTVPVAWTPDAPAPDIGTAVFALANPGGRGLRVTAGFVSSANRRFRGPRGRRIAGAIEHTAPLPRGSSGGPLVDAEGSRRLRRAVGLPERDGLLVRAVEDDGPAGRAGVQRGDLVVEVDRRPVDGVDVLYDVLDSGRDEVVLLLVRGEQEREVKVALR